MLLVSAVGSLGVPVGFNYLAPTNLITKECPKNYVYDAKGKCAEPQIEKRYFIFGAPTKPFEVQSRSYTPKPKIRYNIIILKPQKTPETGPIIVPPPQEKTLVYVLSKKSENPKQDIIKVPFKPQTPEVYYVNYNENENPTLPGGIGIDLKSALSTSPPESTESSYSSYQNEQANGRKSSSVYKSEILSHITERPVHPRRVGLHTIQSSSPQRNQQSSAQKNNLPSIYKSVILSHKYEKPPLPERIPLQNNQSSYSIFKRGISSRDKSPSVYKSSILSHRQLFF